MSFKCSIYHEIKYSSILSDFQQSMVQNSLGNRPGSCKTYRCMDAVYGTADCFPPSGSEMQCRPIYLAYSMMALSKVPQNPKKIAFPMSKTGIRYRGGAGTVERCYGWTGRVSFVGENAVKPTTSRQTTRWQLHLRRPRLAVLNPRRLPLQLLRLVADRLDTDHGRPVDIRDLPVPDVDVPSRRPYCVPVAFVSDMRGGTVDDGRCL